MRSPDRSRNESKRMGSCESTDDYQLRSSSGSGEVAKSGTQRLRSCLSSALISNDKLVGVLSLYSTAERFSDDHRRIVEAVAKHIANSFCWASESDTNSLIDSLTGLPSDPARSIP